MFSTKFRQVNIKNPNLDMFVPVLMLTIFSQILIV